ncbi:hypothetical protein [Candidatus Lokiarchaeum ossiferum]|uniref:hypothetical protein n=1 Tax=Candidatus Lokiarchaeum ossiferum TaxID=2951803 RepID=UPI00352BD30A
MFKLRKFYRNQIISDTKRDWILLLSISISISMVSGLGYFYEASQEYNFDQNFQSLSDFEIIHPQEWWVTVTQSIISLPRIEYSKVFADDDDAILNVLDDSEMEFQEICRYGIVNLEESFICNAENSDFAAKSIYQSEYKKKINATEMQLAVFEDNFYNSSRFSEFFIIVDGQVPNQNTDIMLDYGTALKLNVSVGQITNISVKTGIFFEDPNYQKPVQTTLYDFQIENVCISAIYLPIYPRFSVDQTDFTYSYVYNDYLLKKEFVESTEIDKPAVFSWYNFSGPDWEHPFQRLYHDIDQHYMAYRYHRSTWTHSGYILIYDRSSLDYDELTSQYKVLSTRIAKLTLSIPPDESLVDYLGLQIANFQRDLSKTRFIIQLLNLPLLLFAILFSNMFTNFNFKQKQNEILTLRAKGIPAIVLIRLNIQKQLLYGAICAFLGIVFGILPFFGFQEIIGPFFFNLDSTRLLPKISSFSLIFAVMLSFGINILMLVPSIKNLKKFEFLRINTDNFNIENDDFDPDDRFSEEYPDSKDKKKKKKKVEKKEKVKNTRLFSQKKKKSTSDLEIYTKKKLSWWTRLSILFGLLTVVPFGLIYISLKVAFPDSLIDVIHFMVEELPLFILLVFFGLGFFVNGLVKYFSQYEVKLFTKFSQKMAFICSKEYHLLTHLELLRERNWSKICAIFAIFASILVASNLTFNSQLYLNNFFSDLESEEGISIDNPLLSSQDANLSFELGESGFYALVYKDFLLIGMITIIEIIIIQLLIFKNNARITNNLLGRGIRKKRIIRIELAKSFIILSFALIIGIVSGLLFAWIINSVAFQLKYMSISNIPRNLGPYISIDWIELLVVNTILISISTFSLISGISRNLAKNWGSKGMESNREKVVHFS